MRPALHAEWTKLRTLPGTLWLLVGVVALTVGLTALTSTAVTCRSVGCDQDATRLSLSGVQLGQALVVLLAVLTLSGEYGTGMIRVSLTAVPRRFTLLAAKVIVVTGLTAVTGVLAVALSLLVGRLLLPGSGFTAAHGYPPLSLADGPTLRAAIGTVLYLALVALLSLGVAAALRDAVAAVGAVFGLFYLFPVLLLMVTDPDWLRRLWTISPMNAGLAVQATTDAAGLPLGPWAGLGVLAGWAAAALLGGGLLLRVRDA